MTFDFDPDAKVVPPVHVYHGTRTSADTIRSQGLVYPGMDALLKMIETSMEMIGFSYREWLQYQQKLESNGRLNTIRELRASHRQKIWVTDSESNAWSYANHSPEIVNEAIRNEYYRRHPRKKTGVEECAYLAKRATAWIGTPVVVVLDAAIIGARGGCNQPISASIPPDAIVRIEVQHGA